MAPRRGDDQGARVQPQPLHAEPLGERAIQRALAVGAVADQGMREMFEVAADLVASPAQRLDLDQRHAAGRVAADGKRPFVTGQPAIAGDSRDTRLAGGRQFRVAGQRVIDFAGVGRPAAHQREVAFAHATGFERRAQRARSLEAAGEHEHAGSRLVEPVHRPQRLGELFAQERERAAGFVGIERGRMDQQPRRLVDRDEILVDVQDRQLGGRVHRMPAQRARHAFATVNRSSA